MQLLEQLRAFLSSDQGALLTTVLAAGCVTLFVALPLVTALLALVGARLDGGRLHQRLRRR